MLPCGRWRLEFLGLQAHPFRFGWASKQMAKMREAKTGRFLTSGRETSAPTRAASSLAKGFIDGVGSASIVTDSPKMACRTYKGRGLKGDWIAVGDSIRRVRSAR